jgi:16S rRNA (guanine966-N2)-methyltransferase
MRVIGGRLSGRKFGAPGGRGTRPTSDRVREALASALDARAAFVGASVLDLFAGTGALSFEALSRGAVSAVLVDKDPGVVRQLRQSIGELGLEAETRIARADLLGDPANAIGKLPSVDGGFDLVFCDAPYSRIDGVPALLSELAAQKLLRRGAWLVVERPSQHEWTWPNALAPEAEYRYGQTGISLGVYEP